MIDVVKRHAVKLLQKFRAAGRAQYFRHGLTQGPVLALE
jgi:hypothetical protein